MSNEINQAKALIAAAKITTIYSLDLLNTALSIIQSTDNGFKKAEISYSEIHELIESARFTILMSHFDNLLKNGNSDNFDKLSSLTYNITHYHTFNNDRKSIINQKEMHVSQLLAGLRAKSWLNSDSDYDGLTRDIGFIWESLAKAGLTEKSDIDIFYEPALSTLGLTPSVVDKKLQNACINSLDNKITSLFYSKLKSNLWLDYLSSYIANLHKVNYTLNKWIEESSLKQNIKEAFIQNVKISEVN